MIDDGDVDAGGEGETDDHDDRTRSSINMISAVSL